jgi:sulfhydrogenase subunit beta (sulfur reductase)
MVNTRLSPKALLFPQSEEMLEYSLDESRDDHHIMKEVARDDSPRAVVGIRPCDAKATLLVKLNFDTPDVKDPYWLAAYHATTFVGMACDTPAIHLFLHHRRVRPLPRGRPGRAGHGPGRRLSGQDTHGQGQGLRRCSRVDAGVDDAAAFEAGRKAAESRIVSTVETDNLAGTELLELHGAPFWEDVAFACLNCGTCTFSCPTCWCFDIQDEVHGTSGVRTKNWDSCMFPIFTVHTTGHNPRDTKTQRVRQRFMHKLKYFVDKYDAGIMCVGCGRCVRQCPVNIDIRRVSELMNRYKPADACAVQG